MLFVFLVVVVLSPCLPSPRLPRSLSTREPFAAGHEFAVTGAYEKLIGKAYGEIDPKKHHNKNIINLKNAPLNDRGRVEYSMDMLILKPIDMQRGNQTIFYDVVNRGNQALRVNFGAERSNIDNPRARRRRFHDASRLYPGVERLAGRRSSLLEVVSRQAFQCRRIRMAARSNARLAPSLFFRNQAFRCRLVSTENRWT